MKHKTRHKHTAESLARAEWEVFKRCNHCVDKRFEGFPFFEASTMLLTLSSSSYQLQVRALSSLVRATAYNRWSEFQPTD